MNIIVNRKSFADALKRVCKVVPSRSPKPILEGVCIRVSEQSLTLHGTGLEMSVVLTVSKVQVNATGEIVVNAATLRDVCAKEIGDILTILIDGTQLHVAGANAKFKLPTWDAKKFPDLPANSDPQVTVSAESFCAAINRTVFAAAKEGTRYAFNGALLATSGKSLDIVCTDGRRMATVRLKPSRLEKIDKTIIPARTLKVLTNLVGHGDDIDIAIGKTGAVFSTPGMKLYSVLIEGQFPPHDEVIPKECDKQFRTDADSFADVLSAGACMADGDLAAKFIMGKSGITVTTRNHEGSEASADLAVEFKGEPLTIGFNPRFLAEGVNAAGGEIVAEFTAPNRPALLTCGDFRYVVMPMNLDK